MSKIKQLIAKEISDSRGNPTVEVTCTLESGATGIAAVPSGASTGVHEAYELRDGDKERFKGKGVLKAVGNVNDEIQKNVAGKELDQRVLDNALIALDGTKNKSRLGANAILGVSLAFARAVAAEKGMELYEYIGSLVGNTKFTMPDPLLNIINGGLHADSGLDVQEFMVIPQGFKTFKEKIVASDKIIATLKAILIEKGQSTSIGDEGGFAPKLNSNEAALDLIMEAVTKAGYSDKEVKLAVDVASSSFFVDGKYVMQTGGTKRELSNADMIAWYKELTSKYPLISIEDGLSEDEWESYTVFTKELGEKVQIVGDDLTTTNIERIQTAADKGAINAVLIKLNQIGSLSETIDAIMLTKKQGWNALISHRSGETQDTFIADLAVGLACPYLKAGSLTRPERVCKYDRVAEIEQKLAKV